MNTKNRVIFISGANRGIGKALVDAALASGAKKVYAAARQLKSLPHWNDGRVIPVELDITNERSVLAASKLALDTDLLINNAGVLNFGSALLSDEATLRRDMDTNFYGTLNMVRAFTPILERQGNGGIANLLSIVALASMSGVAGYSASKAALFSATQAMRAELKSKGITVHGVFPGPIDTEMAKEFNLPKTSPEVTAKNILDGIAADQEEIFPDGMSVEIGKQWLHDPKGLERSFASM